MAIDIDDWLWETDYEEEDDGMYEAQETSVWSKPQMTRVLSGLTPEQATLTAKQHNREIRQLHEAMIKEQADV